MSANSLFLECRFGGHTMDFQIKPRKVLTYNGYGQDQLHFQTKKTEANQNYVQNKNEIFNLNTATRYCQVGNPSLRMKNLTIENSMKRQKNFRNFLSRNNSDAFRQIRWRSAAHVIHKYLIRPWKSYTIMTSHFSVLTSVWNYKITGPQVGPFTGH